MFHIMIHSISEIPLFRDSEDKDMYLYLIKKCKLKFPFKVYAFCLMDTHAHFIFDCFGSDISKIMHYLNLCYSMYYNKKYVRRGPLFHDRFKSKIIDSYKYLVNLSAYIHSNPKDLIHADTELLTYRYNSLLDYIYHTDYFSILDKTFLINLLGLSSNESRAGYYRLINSTIDFSVLKDVEIPFYSSQTQDEKVYFKRIVAPEIIIRFIATKCHLSPSLIHAKYHHSLTNFRALCCFMLHAFSSLTHKSICHYIGNITQSRVSSLIQKGLSLIHQTSWIDEFIALNTYTA